MTGDDGDRLADLLDRMTLEEKLGQMTMVAADYAVTGPVLSGDYRRMIETGAAGSVINLWGADAVRDCQDAALSGTRLGIPLLVGFDVIHGHRTIFPVPLAEAGAFEPELWRQTAEAAAEEATADGVALVFAPMLDIARDPRWGRVVETPGEDPVVAARFAQAKIAGFQGTSLADPARVAATAKHFVGYGAVTGGREYASVDVSERSLVETHLPPFAAAVKAGVASVMPAFNDLAGVPMTAHRPLLQGVLRARFGFDGVVISDYAAVAELIAHGVAADLAEAAALALDAGVDIDMMGDAYRLGLPTVLARGRVSIDQIDAAVMRVLRLKQALGLFDRPHARPERTIVPARADAIQELAVQAACRSFVLLRNAGILPLGPGLTRLAVTGPLADAAVEMPGPWAAACDRARSVSYLAGLRAAAGHVEIVGGEEAPSADAIILCVGETAAMSGEAASRAEPTLPAEQVALAERLIATGKPVILVLETGRPLVLGDVADRVAALLVVWHPGTEAGTALARVLFGRAEPGGRLAMGWPAAIGQIPVNFGQRPTGRPAHADIFYSAKYRDAPLGPRYPFGAGRGYADIAWRALRVVPLDASTDETIEVEIDLENLSDRAGAETIFLFSRDPVASVARPLLELQRFERVEIAPRAMVTVRLTVPIRALGFPDAASGWSNRVEPGAFELYAGPTAAESDLFHVAIRCR